MLVRTNLMIELWNFETIQALGSYKHLGIK